MPAPLLLHIEDDAPLRRSVRLTLADEGFDVLEAATGEQGLQSLAHAPQGVVLDLGLPDLDGFEVCARVRERTAGPVLVLSVQSAADDVTRALAAGADDYLSKPFPSADLAHRLRALLSVPGGATGAGPGVPPAGLTVTEARLFLVLDARRGSPVQRDDLLLHVWGVPPVAGVAALVARVLSLQVKLAAAGGPRIGSTATGYRLHA